MNCHDEAAQTPKLLDQLRTACRRRGCSLHTENAYARWVRRYVHFCGTAEGLRHREVLGADGICAFLSCLATDRGVAASTQNQALNALVFLYEQVLDRERMQVAD